MSIDIPSNGGGTEIEVGTPTLPEALPVLPLRESVPFPETLIPLAVGQERSVQLVNDVLGGNRMLVMVAVARPRDREPGPERPLQGRRGRGGGAHDQGARTARSASSSRVPSASSSASSRSRGPTSSRA